jgi:hypothetical protein
MIIHEDPDLSLELRGFTSKWVDTKIGFQVLQNLNYVAINKPVHDLKYDLLRARKYGASKEWLELATRHNA